MAKINRDPITGEIYIYENVQVSRRIKTKRSILNAEELRNVAISNKHIQELNSLLSSETDPIVLEKYRRLKEAYTFNRNQLIADAKKTAKVKKLLAIESDFEKIYLNKL